MEFKRLIEISRPVGWVAAPLMILLAIFNFGEPEITGIFYIELLLYSFPFCLFLYGINDIYDRDTDKENNRKEEGSPYLAGRLLNEDIDGFLKKYSAFLVFLLLSIPLIRQNMLHLSGSLMFISFSYLYSAPPYRFKARAPLDSLSNSVIYFLGPFMIGLSYTDAVFPWSFVFWMAAATFAGHAFTTIMDYKPDKKADLNTFAVRFGRRETALFSSLLLVFLAAIPSIITELRMAAVVMSIITLPMVKEEFQENYAARVFQIYVVIIVLALSVVTLGNL